MNDELFKAVVMKMVNLDNSPNKEISISGGRATHSFNEVNSFETTSLKLMITKLIRIYGIPYDQIENRLFFNVDQDSWTCSACPENYDVYIETIIQKDVDTNLLTLTVKKAADDE